MTVKEFYQWAKENQVEDFNLGHLLDGYWDSDITNERISIDKEQQYIFIG